MLKSDENLINAGPVTSGRIYSSSIAAVRKDLDIPERVRWLAGLDRYAIVIEWTRINKHPPPLNLSRSLLLKAVAYQLQEIAYGGLKKSTRERLRKIAVGAVDVNGVSTQFNTGTRLLREWHGATHEVVIEDRGVRYKGQIYRSLSEVAQVITGTKWSGPVFFGLRKRPK